MHSTQTAVQYPRTYRASRGSKFMACFVGVLCVAAGALGIWFFGAGHGTLHSRGFALLLTAVSAAFLLAGTYLVRQVLSFRIVLSTDAIEIGPAARATVLRRDELAGWRMVQQPKGPSLLMLVPRDALRRPIKIQQLYNRDAAFESWLAQLPDLDAQDRLAAEREIADNPDLGLTPDERMAKLAAARRTSSVLIGVFFLAAAWAYIYPRPYWLAVSLLAALPWIAIIITARSHGLFRIDQNKNDPHPSVAFPFLGPGFILALRAIIDLHVLRWQQALWLALGLGLVLWLAALMSDAALRAKALSAAVLFFLVLAYGYGAGMLGNALLDKSPATVYATKLVSKSVSRGRSTTYRLQLDSWGPRRQPTTVDVSRSLYNAVQPGKPVCIVLRPGAFRVAWYVVHGCR